MHPARPTVRLRSCPACGKDVDPLRAGRVVILEDGARYLCGQPCREAFLRGERAHERISRIPPKPRSVPERVRDATRPRIDLASASQSTPLASLAPPEPPPVPPWPALVIALAGVVVGVVADTLSAAALSAGLSFLAALASMISARTMLPQVGWLPAMAGPAGALLASVAAFVSWQDGEGQRGLLVGAGIAAGAISLRAWLDARARVPVDRLVRGLRRPLPPRVRVPIEHEDPLLRYEEVRTEKVRTGEEVFAVEGEVVGVDGVVQGGEAFVLQHPTAQTPVRVVPGDSVLAGARITEGAIRLLATRVGEDRALCRGATFGRAQRGGARVVRLAEQVARWGGFAAVTFALFGLALTGNPGLAGALAAAAAVLVAAPLLAARRSAESPLVAAATSAMARGIVFHDPRALEDAGRIATAALNTAGTITEGRPEVTEVALIDDDGDARTLLALAAGVEANAPRHPLGDAVLRHAKQKRIAPAAVRRVIHHPGRGVSALTTGGEPVLIGNRQLLLDHGVSIAVADTEAGRAESRGHTALFLGVGGRVRAVIALRDEVGVGARAAVQRMFDQRIVVVLVSGDSRATVEVIAKQLDVNLVKAELLPEERAEEVRRLGASGGLVAAVGRPGADDDMLGASDVPMLLGAAGSPGADRGVAMATTDVRDAAAALWMARASRAEALRSVLLSVGVGGPLVAGAALGWVSPGVAAVASVAIDAFALPAGARLLRRIELRIPPR